MNRIKLSLFLFLKIIFLCNSKLLFVNVHFRHGARGSLFLDRKKGYDLLGMKWKKRGMLTPKGKRQVFLNGVKHREKYLHFLNEEYIEDEIKAFSTDSYRAISSLECYLNGIYYNHDYKENILSDGITVYPPGNVSEYMKSKTQELGINSIPKDNHIIPINIFQKSEHAFVLHEPGKISDCQKISKIREKITSQNKYLEISENFRTKYEQKLKNFYNNNNISINFEFTQDKINLFCDCLYSDLTDSRNLSHLEKEGIKIEELNEFCNNILSLVQQEIVSGDKDVVMMSQTPPVKKLLDWMDKRIELDKKGESDQVKPGYPKYTIWSGHDSSVSTTQMFMKNIFGTKWTFPYFSSTVIFELHKNEKINNKDNDYIYEIRYYVNDKLLLNINYLDFKNRISGNLWTQEKIDNFCEFSIINSEKVNKKIKKYHIIILILIVVLLISLVFNCKNYFSHRIKHKEN